MAVSEAQRHSLIYLFDRYLWNKCIPDIVLGVGIAAVSMLCSRGMHIHVSGKRGEREREEKRVKGVGEGEKEQEK